MRRLLEIWPQYKHNEFKMPIEQVYKVWSYENNL